MRSAPVSSDTDQVVLAMQLCGHVERSDPPPVQDICAAIALATVTLLDDARAQPGGPWHHRVQAWNGAQIRKLVRRGRGAAWQKAQEAPGVTVRVGQAEARAFVPGPVDDIHPAVAKLQIQSTELTRPERVEAMPTGAGLHIAVTPAVDMSWGKQAAQCAHAAQRAWMTASPYTLAAWESTGRPIVVIYPTARLWARLVDEAPTHIRDGGFTEIAAGTLTAVAWWTAPSPDLAGRSRGEQ